jgi:hypothetical protein
VGDLLHREGLSKPYSRRSLPPGRSSVIDPTAPNESWAADWIEQGLICILTAVEPCLSYGIIRNREAQHLQLRPRHRKCLYLYHYQIHPISGVRRQSGWMSSCLIQQCSRTGQALPHQDAPDAALLCQLAPDIDPSPWDVPVVHKGTRRPPRPP